MARETVERSENRGSARHVSPIGKGELSAAMVPELIDALTSRDGLERRSARLHLVLLGEPAVPALVEALHSPESNVRWEAAKALIEIPSRAATPALVKALEDENSDVRWLAAEALVARKRQGAIAVLEALLQADDDSIWVREGAHHVLHDLTKGQLADILRPVLEALDTAEWSAIIPASAGEALDKLRNNPS